MWTNYKTAISIVEQKAIAIWEETAKKQNKADFAPAMCLAIALKCQARVLEKVNSETLQSLVCWDEKLDLPSSPTLAADAAFFGEELAKSFSHWAELWEETLEKCYCGSFFKNGHGRNVQIKIMTNHCLEAKEDSLLVRQFIGIKTDDLNHARHHYNLAQESQIIKDLIIVWVCENQIMTSGKFAKVVCAKKEKAECIHEPAFLEYISNLWNKICQTKGEENGKRACAQ